LEADNFQKSSQITNLPQKQVLRFSRIVAEFMEDAGAMIVLLTYKHLLLLVHRQGLEATY